MRRRLHVRTVAMLFAVLTAARGAAAQPIGSGEATGVEPADAAAIASSVRDYLRASGLPGAAVAVTHGSRVVLAEGYGRTPSGGPITANTPMAVASVSKSFTALAVMQLVEAGLVDLDAPVRAHLSEFVMADPRAEQITVRQLLQQTSGLSDRTFPAFSRRQPRSPRELVAGLRTARLASDPGTAWEYHNPNYQVAARLVEVVSGRPFGAYLRERVFRPLGMHDSTAIDTAAELPASAAGHLMILGQPLAVPEPRAFGGGSGGVLSSAHDMAAWLIAQNSGGRGPTGNAVCSERAIAEMRTPGPASRSYGLGWFVGRSPSGAPRLWHSGDLFTSTAQQIVLPASGHGIAVMANTGLAYGDARGIAERILALVERREPPPAAAWPFIVLDALMVSLTVAAIWLVTGGVRRSGAWARRVGRTPMAILRVALLLTPAILLASMHRVVGTLYRGRDIAWVQVPYLFPTLVLLLAVLAAGGLAVFGARVVAMATASKGRRRRG